MSTLNYTARVIDSLGLAAEAVVSVELAGESFDHTLANTTLTADLVIDDGSSWFIGPNVTLNRCSIRVNNGVLAMRPGSSLFFTNGVEAEYVGGGLHSWEAAFANDFGIWVGHSGRLDIAGTPKTGWNRTGSDPSWLPGDELWISPTAHNDFSPRRWFPGDAIPRAMLPVGAVIPPGFPAEWATLGIPAEVMNVTRDVLISAEFGAGHIHIHSDLPQRVEYATLRNMGASPGGNSTSGRYALHSHHSLEGARGGVVRGVAAIGTRSRSFVPHASHGMSFIDVVSVNSRAEGFWWDEGEEHQTHDTFVDRLCVSGVGGEGVSFDCVSLPFGERNHIQDSVVSGAFGNKLANGWDWPAGHIPPAVWKFVRCIGHNVQGRGVRFWNNSKQPHLVENYIGYRCGNMAIENGAYSNSNLYRDCLLFEDGFKGQTPCSLLQHSNSHRHEINGVDVMIPGQHLRGQFYAKAGPALLVMGLNMPAGTREEYIDCTLVAAAGHPKVRIDEAQRPWMARFVGCGLMPSDFVFTNPAYDPLDDDPGLEGTSIWLEEDGQPTTEIYVEGGVVKTRTL